MHRGQGIRQFVHAFQMLANVICIEHRVFGGLPHPRAVRQDVRQRAHQHAEVAAEGLHSANRFPPHRLQRETAIFFFHQNRHGAERLENLLHGYRPGSRTAAAMWRRKGLVQVEVHDVDANIARPCDSRERIHVGAVHVHQRAFGVQNLRDFGQVLLVNSQRRRVGDHQRSHVFVHQSAQACDINLSVCARLDVFHFVSSDHCRGRIRPVRGVRNQHFLPWIPLFLQISPDQQQSGKLALRSCGGLQRDGIHASNFQQTFFQQPLDFEAALREIRWLIRVLRCDSLEPGHKFIHARVVLHRAGAQRIHAQVNGMVPGGKPREMSNHLDLADFWKALDAIPPMMCAQHLRCIRHRNVQGRQFERTLSWRRLLEDQSFLLAYVPRSFFDFFVHVSHLPGKRAQLVGHNFFYSPKPAVPAHSSPLLQIVQSPRGASFPLRTPALFS